MAEKKDTKKKVETPPAPEQEKPIEGEFKDQSETALAVTAPKEVALSTQDPAEFLERAVRQADALKKVIDAKKLAIYIGGGTKAHVLIDGWQTLMALNGVMPFTVSAVQMRCVAGECQVMKDCRGQRLTAHVVTEIRRVSDGTVLTRVETECSQHESRWARSDDYAVLSMAQTRGVGKGCRQLFGWVMALAGYSATPAEEMPQTGPAQTGARDEDPGPPADAAPAPAKQEPKPAQGTPPAADQPDPSGWEYVIPFQRWRVEHQDAPAAIAFKKFFADHDGIRDWATLKAKWGEKCWMPADKEFGMTIKDEVLHIIGTAPGFKVEKQPDFDPDKVPA